MKGIDGVIERLIAEADGCVSVVKIACLVDSVLPGRPEMPVIVGRMVTYGEVV